MTIMPNFRLSPRLRIKPFILATVSFYRWYFLLLMWLGDIILIGQLLHKSSIIFYLKDYNTMVVLQLSISLLFKVFSYRLSDYFSHKDLDQ